MKFQTYEQFKLSRKYTEDLSKWTSDTTHEGVSGYLLGVQEDAYGKVEYATYVEDVYTWNRKEHEEVGEDFMKVMDKGRWYACIIKDKFQSDNFDVVARATYEWACWEVFDCPGLHTFDIDECIANKFREAVISQLTQKELEDIDNKHRTPDFDSRCNAVHDHLDANMVMAQAVSVVLGVGITTACNAMLEENPWLDKILVSVWKAVRLMSYSHDDDESPAPIFCSDPVTCRDTDAEIRVRVEDASHLIVIESRCETEEWTNQVYLYPDKLLLCDLKIDLTNAYSAIKKLN